GEGRARAGSVSRRRTRRTTFTGTHWRAAKWSNSSIPNSRRCRRSSPRSSAIAWSTTGWSSTASASTARTDLRRVLAASRWMGVGLGFLTIVPSHAVVALAGRRELLPPLFLATMGRIAGLRVRTEGVARPGALFLANHVSWLDIFALARTSRATFVAHSGLSGHGGLRWLCDQNDTGFITREQRGSV